ncbi:MAG TPA: hypothetical protein VIY53_12680, partial [Acidobacteriaceae bacterium]
VRHRHFDLPQQVHHLLRGMLPSSCHLRLLLLQFLSFKLVQNSPGTPDVKVAQELLRHANSRITMDLYTQAVSADKRDASLRQVEMLLAQPAGAA